LGRFPRDQSKLLNEFQLIKSFVILQQILSFEKKLKILSLRETIYSDQCIQMLQSKLPNTFLYPKAQLDVYFVIILKEFYRKKFFFRPAGKR
jgi:hypothetical protein